MDLLVVGAGEMGRWLAGVVADDRDVTVAFADADPAAARAAAGTVGGDAVASER
jgi:prephenate dehydrogenase